METSAPPRGRTFHPAQRLPLVKRRRLERQAARRRVAAHARKPLSAPQRALDPLAHRGRSLGAQAWKVLAALAGSSAVHGAVVLLGVLAGTVGLSGRPEVRQEVTVTVRERPPTPPPPPPEKPPEKPPEPTQPEVIEKPVRPLPKVAKAPPPTAEPPKGPPPRVVGLSAEFTSEGGEGPAFATGNTRAGQTAEKAVDPKALAPAPAEAPVAPDPATTNRAASRIPTAGVAYSPPKCEEPKVDFPPTLQAQGIEADVTVLVNLDATGKALKVKIIKEAPYPEFNEAAREYALARPCQPATRDGVPIPYTLSYLVRFRLEDK